MLRSRELCQPCMDVQGRACYFEYILIMLICLSVLPGRLALFNYTMMFNGCIFNRLSNVGEISIQKGYGFCVM